MSGFLQFARISLVLKMEKVKRWPQNLVVKDTLVVLSYLESAYGSLI